jgi:catechol 2,3-dioxygenase-like lactoylglutathione lyase family enzyme
MAGVKGLSHIALIVSDVGLSTYFYSNILGLEQVKRPNFDRHGAWFSLGGGVELHLIKGKPLVHDGSHLIVNHLALDVVNPALTLQYLIKMKITFEQNVSVPKGRFP